jgi:hypothetical protein
MFDPFIKIVLVLLYQWFVIKNVFLNAKTQRYKAATSIPLRVLSPIGERKRKREFRKTESFCLCALSLLVDYKAFNAFGFAFAF